MKIDSIAVPTSKRIVGTLHARGGSQHAPTRNECLPSEKTVECEVADSHKVTVQRDYKKVR